MKEKKDNTIQLQTGDDIDTNDSECNDSEALEIMINDYTGHQAINSSDTIDNVEDIYHQTCTYSCNHFLHNQSEKYERKII